MATEKIKELTRDEAEAACRAGRRVRLPYWQGWWTCKDGEIVNQLGNPRSFEGVAKNDRYAVWRLLKERPTRTSLEAEVAMASITEKALVADGKRLRAALDDLHRDVAQLSSWRDAAKEEAAHHLGKYRALLSEAEQLRARCERLAGDLTEAKANALPLLRVGARVEASGRAGKVVNGPAYFVQYGQERLDSVWTYAADLTLVEEAKPAEPTWTPCSAAEAREKHATGMRVRHRTWKPDVWCFGGKPSVPTSDMAMWVLQNLNGNSDWQWSAPLAEGGGQ